MASWKAASAMGFKFEDFSVKDINEKILPLAYKNMTKEKYSYYDIILFNGNFAEKAKTMECKFDEMAITTGNICIETGCNGKSSGFMISEADFWLITDGITTFLIKKDNIRACIVEHMDEIEYKAQCKVKQGRGYYKEMDMYLIPKKIFEPYCSEISGVDDMKYNCLL